MGEPYQIRGPRCFVMAVCDACEREASRAAEHADGCPARRQKWHLRKLVPVIRTPFPAEDYVAVKRTTIQGAIDLWDEAHRTDDPIALGAAIVGLREAMTEMDSVACRGQEGS